MASSVLDQDARVGVGEGAAPNGFVRFVENAQQVQNLGANGRVGIGQQLLDEAPVYEVGEWFTGPE